MIDPAFKRRWLRALETPPDQGGYLKGTGTLVKRTSAGDRFCCLGVALNELIKTGEVTTDWDEGCRPGDLSAPCFSTDTLLPIDVRMLIGITDIEQGDLADLNDNHPRDRFKYAIQYIKDKL